MAVETDETMIQWIVWQIDLGVCVFEICEKKNEELLDFV